MNEATHNGTDITIRLTRWLVSLDYWLVWHEDAYVDYTGAMVWP